MIALGVVSVALIGAPALAQSDNGITIERVFPALSFRRPVIMAQPPGDPGQWYVVEQAGRVLVFENRANASRARVVLDIRDRIDDGPNEAGLLGLAFHPDFATNRQIYLSYTRRGSPLTSVIARFTMAADGRTIDGGSERIVLTLDQPFGNHNGGHIAFGPDGFLYAGFGDGGAGGDPFGNGQNTQTLLASIIRIDVDAGAPYAIPADNPFAGGGGAPEIYAYGLRNPWRWSFDRATGALWVADVGQNRWEEVDRIVKGGNYGWNLREGAHDFGRARPARGLPGLIEPVAEYSHAEGCSITGGFVYRGRDIPAILGQFVFGDFCSGRIWAVPVDPRAAPNKAARVLADTPLSISAFAQDARGELYALDFRSGGIYRIAPE